MNGGRQLTDSVVGRDRPRIAIVTRGYAVSRKRLLASCDRTSASAICTSPKWGSSPFHHSGNQRNSEEFRSATATRHWVGGRLMVRQTDWEGSPCPAWDGGNSSPCWAARRRHGRYRLARSRPSACGAWACG